MEISKILQKNNGKIFVIKQEKNNGTGKEGQEGANIEEFS
jgi:hypothetical protein